MNVRILFFQPVPSVITNWLKGRFNTNTVSRGLSNENFMIVDLHMDDDQAVLFRLMFPKVVFTQQELELSDAPMTDVNRAAKSSLFDAKLDEYMALYTDEERTW